MLEVPETRPSTRLSPMQRRSYGIVRIVVAGVLLVAIELWARSHVTWAPEVRYAAHAVGAVLMRRTVPRPEAVGPGGARHVAGWVPIDVLRAGSTPLYPPGALELLLRAG